MSIPRILVIAGSDSGGGAGIQADIKTITMLGGHAMTAVTALTAQNTLGVTRADFVDPDMVTAQIEAVLTDFDVDAVKIGMLGSGETANRVADLLAVMDGAGPRRTPIIFDPVMVSTSGSRLATEATIACFERFMRMAVVATPNVDELEVLRNGQSLSELAERTACAILAKGGDREGELVEDVLVTPEGVEKRWSSPRIATRHTHGTGCTLASAVAVGLAEGRSLPDAIGRARAFVREALLAAPGLGGGHGPMGHGQASSGLLNLNQVTIPARDYAESVAFYRRLGLTQIVDSPPRYARFECPGGATLSIHTGANESPGDSVVYFESADLDAWVERLRVDGVAFESGPADQGWGWREARLRDPAGNRLCLYRAGENRRFPPWRVQGEAVEKP